MSFLNDEACLDNCGIAELAHINDGGAEDVFFTFMTQMEDKHTHIIWGSQTRYRPELREPMVLFSSAVKPKHRKASTGCSRFAAYIKRHRLGAVVKTKGVINPSSGNVIVGYLWTPNYKDCDKLYEKLDTKDA
jgi:hypothetical protein